MRTDSMASLLFKASLANFSPHSTRNTMQCNYISGFNSKLRDTPYTENPKKKYFNECNDKYIQNVTR